MKFYFGCNEFRNNDNSQLISAVRFYGKNVLSLLKAKCR